MQSMQAVQDVQELKEAEETITGLLTKLKGKTARKELEAALVAIREEIRQKKER